MLSQRKLTVGSPVKGGKGVPSVVVRQQPPRAARAGLLNNLSLYDQFEMLTAYKKTVEKTAAGQLDTIDKKIDKVHQRILLAKASGADIHLPAAWTSPGRAPPSDMKNHGKKRSPTSRKRGQARNRLRFTTSPTKYLGDVSEM